MHWYRLYFSCFEGLDLCLALTDENGFMVSFGNRRVAWQMVCSFDMFKLYVALPNRARSLRQH